ncbi:NAD(P)H-dependent oxidoreductase [Flavobacterium sp.]|uniref:NAD(P)H-dependent oxidoreductase n=1 Tax=Flavobacterium sp. TaxID=239 RepID=UPI00286DD028|nr:NAD(P)H-dependent oxidoreductase [Flavobacterium sp.]
MKNILIINAHPDKESFCFALAESYKNGADLVGTDCKLVHLIDLKFNPILTYGYRKISELEPDLVQMQKDILWADHLVFVYPNWWATFPALLKGFIDRVFVPGFAFKYRENSSFWDKLLKGKTARLIVTMDTPSWYYWFKNRSPGHNAMKIGVLEFCGIKPVKIKVFSGIKASDEAKRKKWLEEVKKLGEKQKKIRLFLN